ncbi:MAG: LysR substrate-binding domain-containing protein [Hyphomicrobiales bacterium]|nr:LysR substrate-binding domain-containing protein [Hyphomicrobiales bacterium]
MRTNWHSLREFEALRAVIATGTATAAARRIGISQSAVSRAISQLEARTGQLLFERLNGRLSPTAEALALNENLDPLFDTLTRIDTKQWSVAAKGELRLVATPTLAHRFLPPRIASFSKLHPERSISLDVCAGDPLITGIAEERYDIGVMDINTDHAGVHYEPFRTADAVCLLPRAHPLCGQETIKPEHLAGQPFVALTRRHSLRTAIDRLCADAGIELVPAVETSTVVALAEFVRAGMGLTVINPFPILASLKRDVVVRPFRPKLPRRACFVVPSTSQPNAIARTFIRHVRMSTRNFPHSEAC